MTRGTAHSGWRLRLFSGVLLAPVASLAIVLAWVEAFPAETAHRLIWAGLLFPVLWPAFMFYAYWAERAYRPCLLLVMASLASAALILAP